MKLNILAIYGSPRQQGFSAVIHDKFLEPFCKDVILNKIFVYEEKILPCNACGICASEDKCPINDSMQKIYSLIKTADLVTISSPLYFSSLPGPLKNLIDRCEILWNNKIDNRKGTGFFISTAGHNGYKNMFLPSITVLRHFFKTAGFICNEDDFILMPGTDALKKVPDGIMDTAYNTGGIYFKKIRNI